MVAVVILFGAGVMVEIFAVLFAPMGYQDADGFHAVADGMRKNAPSLAEKSSGWPQ